MATEAKQSTGTTAQVTKSWCPYISRFCSWYWQGSCLLETHEWRETHPGKARCPHMRAANNHSNCNRSNSGR